MINQNSDKVELRIPIDVYMEVMDYVLASDVEVSGMGQIKFIDGVPTVTKAHITKQECSGTETELDADALGELEYECMDGRYAMHGELLWWWHSHVDMGTFWSSTDMNAIHTMGDNGSIFATVFNKKWDMLSAYYQGSNDKLFLPRMFKTGLNTEISCSKNAKETVSKMVTKPKPAIHYNYGSTFYPPRWEDTWAPKHIAKPVETKKPKNTKAKEKKTSTNLWEEIQREDNFHAHLVETYDFTDGEAQMIIDDYVLQYGELPLTEKLLEMLVAQNYDIKEEDK